MKSTAPLRAVGDDDPAPTSMERAQRLAAEAKALIHEEIDALEARACGMVQQAGEIARCELAPVGVREFCRRMAEEIDGRLQGLAALRSKGGR